MEADAITVDQKTYYTGGLFKYDAGLDASNVKDKNVWTDKALFDNVLVSKDANIEDFVAKKMLQAEQLLYRHSCISQKMLREQRLKTM